MSSYSCVPPTPAQARWIALIFAICFLVPALMASISVIEAERTGIAAPDPIHQDTTERRIIRSQSPTEFNAAITGDVELIIFGGTVSIVSFCFYRRLSR